MAITAIAPDPGPQPIPDPVTFDEAALLFKETELPEFAGSVKRVSTKLYRWAREDHLTLGRRGRPCVVSYSDLLEAHGRRYPAPGR
ncbi:hypothetical protein [Streptomyces pseudovenezuelae]|uniref:hypothetical protein n=1 Tax=Streptomyces pseudovenezuelae TaxID=67350 RepID=UPI002E7FEB28|nr:hypothetical protein [Streptomyces pseudovenezuelae]WUA94528.1 hypothetical protein OHO81_44955 [Streptomyces pseudovenezuelae]